ncbi:MAG: S-layer homology domain-containing protein, partial [Oscillospiraceae bacterium]
MPRRWLAAFASTKKSRAGLARLFHRVWAEYSPAKFSDVPYSQWYYQYVSPLACAGIMDGYEDGSFRPSGNITAGEALKLVLLAAGYPAQERTGAHWASGYLDLALSEGILSE